jgi:hypothetical protein
MYIILFATTTISTWQKSIRKKLKQKGGAEVEDLVYFQAGISQGSLAHAQGLQRLLHWRERRLYSLSFSNKNFIAFTS